MCAGKSDPAASRWGRWSCAPPDSLGNLGGEAGHAEADARSGPGAMVAKPRGEATPGGGDGLAANECSDEDAAEALPKLDPWGLCLRAGRARGVRWGP